MFARFQNYITGGLLIALALVSLGWYIDNNKLAACQAGRKADKALYEKAQADALALHLEALRKKEKEYEAKANKADEAYSALSRKYNDAVRVYATAQSKARTTTAASASGSPTSDNRPSEDTEFLEVREVVVPVRDLMICAENTARLVIARDWALGLNE